jgi:hypothetical protein
VPPQIVMDMLPPGVMQHTFDITIQAPNAAKFTTPAVLTMPNVFNAAPGTQLDILSFDHTTGRLVIDGTGTVSADGQTVTSDPGTGVTAPGWHGMAPPGDEGFGGGPPSCGGPPPNPNAPTSPDNPQLGPGDTKNELNPTSESLNVSVSNAESAASSQGDGADPEWSITAPKEKSDPNQPPSNSPNVCVMPGAPPPRPPQPGQPYEEMTVLVDGPLKDIANPIDGSVPLQSGSYIVNADSSSTTVKFGYTLKSEQELKDSSIINTDLNNDQFYEAAVTVTIDKFDGTNHHWTIEHDYPNVWINAVDPIDGNAYAAFFKTNSTITRDKTVDLHTGKDELITFDSQDPAF